MKERIPTNETPTAIITSEPTPHGVCFGEVLETNLSILVPLKEVIGDRRLHTNDYIVCDVVENERRPGKFRAINVRWVGRYVARQVGGRS